MGKDGLLEEDEEGKTRTRILEHTKTLGLGRGEYAHLPSS